LSNGDCASFLPYLVRNGTKNIVLAHLSQNNNKPYIALSESRGSLNSFGFSVDVDFGNADVRLCAASPDCIVNVF
jgi:hypothetical protein